MLSRATRFALSNRRTPTSAREWRGTRWDKPSRAMREKTARPALTSWATRRPSISANTRGMATATTRTARSRDL